MASNDNYTEKKKKDNLSTWLALHAYSPRSHNPPTLSSSGGSNDPGRRRRRSRSEEEQRASSSSAASSGATMRLPGKTNPPPSKSPPPSPPGRKQPSTYMGRTASPPSLATPPTLRSRSSSPSKNAPKPSSPFPSYDLLPKSETNASRFLLDHPSYDGRGITIGILDTGVDPGASGMQHLRPADDDPSGGHHASPKLVDVVDCTGSGDVCVGTEGIATLVEERGEEGGGKGGGGGGGGGGGRGRLCWEVKGLSGRTLKLNPDWIIRPFPERKDTGGAAKKEAGTEKASKGSDSAEGRETKEKNADDDDEGSSDPEKKKKAGDGDDDDETKGSKEEEGGATSATAATVAVRLGVKRAYELFPSRLASRVRSHRRKAFDAARGVEAAKVRSALEKWTSDHTDPQKVTREDARVRDDLKCRLDALEAKGGDDDGVDGGGPSLCDDPGPIYDIVVYHDGTDYRAVLDASESGDLTRVPRGMTDFRKEREYATFGVVDMYNYAVNFHDGGTILSVVCDAGAHGSHVAGIAAGYHPASSSTDGEGEGGGANGDDNGGGDDDDEEEEEKELRESRNRGIDCMSGVAPGAKIVSLKIGDTRLGSMETGTALARAAIEAVRLKCDVVNLSYGEGCALPNVGRFPTLAKSLVRRHGVVFVSSAGNNGPGLSTVGAPGGTTSGILGVAAYVSPGMMKAGYSMIDPGRHRKESRDGGAEEEEGKEADKEKSPGDAATKKGAEESSPTGPPPVADADAAPSHPGTTYTWSSVGPAVDGDFGVDLTAPGGAIASVPNWTLQRNQLMNGTSMSSPHAAGCVALLLSGCKALRMKVAPARVTRALVNTAREMDGLDVLQQGAGMIQVDKAWEYLLAHKDCPYEDFEFDARIENRPDRPRGVYLRQPHESSVVQTLSVKIDPKLGAEDDYDLPTQRLKVEFEMRFRLTSSDASWVKCPDHFALMHNGRSFKIEVDPRGLPPGVHAAKVLGFDSARDDAGPMFVVPITVVKTLERRDCVSLGRLQFEPTEVKRYFLDPPPNATWMDVTIRDLRDPTPNSDSSPRLVVLHTIQLLPHEAYRDNECEKYFNLSPSQVTVTSIPIRGGVTAEVSLARYWSTIGDTAVDVSMQFRGVRPSPEVLTVTAGIGSASVLLSSDVKDEPIKPTAKLVTWKTPLRPKLEGSISPLGERDVADDGRRIYQLVLTYEFEQEESGTVTPRVPALQGYLYESAYESQLILLFDKDKRYLGVADSWPSGVKVPKGKITIRLQIRHDQPEMLEKLKDSVVWIERKLEKEIAFSAYHSHEAAMVGKDAIKKRLLRKGNVASVHFAEPPSSKIPKGCKCGDVLEGTASYVAGDTTLPGEGKKPGGFPVRYVVGPKADAKGASDSEGVTPEAPDERTVEEKIEEAVRKCKVDELSKLTTKEKDEGKFEELYERLLRDYADYIPLRMAGLKYYDDAKKRDERLDKILDSSDHVLKLISETDVALHFGVKHDKDDPKSCKERKDMEEKKSFLVEVLARKAYALASLGRKSTAAVEGDDEGNDDKFDSALKQLQKWVDIDSDKKYSILVLERERRAGRHGSVLKTLNGLLKNGGDDTKGGICPLSKSDLLQRRSEVFGILGYDMLMENDRRWQVVSCPKDYALF